MTTSKPDIDADRALWACGSYARVAELVVPMAEELVGRAQLAPGMRVLDIAAGTGNVALAAARAGASVTASDLTPELLAVGADRARTLGAAIEWVHADAQDLPFADDSFDVVLSCLGVIFAPDHLRAARELLRVCRPGGTIALANWTPGGYGGAFFDLLARHAPNASGERAGTAPIAWGDPGHVSEQLGAGVRDLRCVPQTFPLAFTGGRDQLFELYRDCFGPVIQLRAQLLNEPERLTALDHELREFLRTERLEHVEYLAVTAIREPRVVLGQ